MVIEKIANAKAQRYVSLLILCTLLLGILFYGIYRQHAIPYVLTWVVNFLPRSDTHWISSTPDGLLTSLPSFLHALACTLSLQLIRNDGTQNQWMVNVLFIVFLFFLEFTIGTIDIADLIAVTLGFLTAIYVSKSLPTILVLGRFRTRIRMIFVAVLTSLLATASFYGPYSYSECARYSGGVCVEYKENAEPIYMDYQTLRNAVQLETARPPDNLGRIYLYNDYLFLNEVNQGIHIFNNQDNTNPENIGFMRIPGNREVVIRNDYLYADSYVDLVTIDLTNLTMIQVIDRQQDIFPYDAFQNIPNNISFSRFTVDPTKGVVIGYRLVGD